MSFLTNLFDQKRWSFLNPIVQAVAIFAAGAASMIFYKVLDMLNLTSHDQLFYWILSGTFIMFFAFVNSVTSLNVKGDLNPYWQRSIPCYVAVATLLVGLAWLLSGINMDKAGSIRYIFFVLTFGYLLLLSLMRFFRKIVALAQREDNRWQQRAKNKKK